MRDFLEEFEKRNAEVRRYLAVLLAAERINQRRSGSPYDDQLKIFRAGALLIVYNAVEASARLGILAIYDEIERTSTTFDQLREAIRRRVLVDFRAHVGIDTFHEITRIAHDIVWRSLDQEKLFSGNVDAKKMRDAAAVYGFPDATDWKITRHGKDLVKVKSRRQDLAHGNRSFSEVGKEYTSREVEEIARYSMAYMQAILRHIDKYLDDGGYLIPVTPEPPPQPRAPRSWRQRLARAWAELRSR